ncbi:MAG TPA: NHL repeat-containing protein [Candidatus Binataceae bacterium]|nr:NHL repeat-containing protein [Candidatus Binataceae bacterium]
MTGATVTLYAASNNYGATPSPLATATSDGSGDFTLGYTPPTPGTTVLYVTAVGGTQGANTNANSAIGLSGVVGTAASPEPSVVINELTTVAHEWAMAQFTDTTGQYTGAPSTNVIGLGNAAAQAQVNLADVTSGNPASFWTTYNATEANCTSVSPPVNCDGLERMNTFANILAACIQSSGPSSSECTTLLGDTGTGSTTLQAAHYMATNPTASLVALFGLQGDSTYPFTPYLSTAPDGWELALNLSPTGANFSHPNSVAIDANGDAWVPNSTGNTLTELTPSGALGANYTASNPTGADFNDPVGVAIDPTGDVWVTNDGNTGTGANSLTELVPGISPTATVYDSSNASSAAFDGPYAIAIDTSGNAWVTNLSSDSVSELVPATLSSSVNYTNTSLSGADFSYPFAVALDDAVPANIWVTNLGGDSVTELTSTGTLVGNYNNTSPAGAGFLVPDGIALDAASNVWVPNFFGNSVTALTSGGALFLAGNFDPLGADFDGPYGIAVDSGTNVWITNSSGTNLTELAATTGDFTASFTPAGANFNSPFGIAIDESGNIWITNNGGNSVAEFVGAASPVLTPPVACLSTANIVCKP